MEKKRKKNWFVNISEYHHRTMGLRSSYSPIDFYWDTDMQLQVSMCVLLPLAVN